MTVELSTRLATRFQDAVTHTRDALAENGFGVLAEINIAAALKANLDVDMEDYLVLAACNPGLAHRAITVDREIGLLLPCNVLVRTDPDHPGTVIVDAMDPGLLAEVTGEPAIVAIAEQVTTRLGAAIASLAPRCG
jgi:uncharacterized protein (DUF302 family)